MRDTRKITLATRKTIKKRKFKLAPTIDKTVKELQSSIVDYIEATYHISNPKLIQQRRQLLNEPGVVHQPAYIESTPRYKSEQRFAEILGLHVSAITLFESLANAFGKNPLIYNPPYRHQAQAVSSILVENKNVIIMTGTGSGKTESFLLPILGKLAIEAADVPNSFSEEGLRALVLYPMNALVNDQLGRLRSFFGNEALKEYFRTTAGRIPRFARYTSRTPYAGVRNVSRDQRKLKPIYDFYVYQLRTARSGTAKESSAAAQLIAKLKDKGKWPGKPDIEAWYGESGKEWIDPKTKKYQRAITLPDDSELITRHEIQDTVPDLLVTNYSMLEYMMLRPIERSIFDRTRERLERFPEEKFIVVLDEAHLYRGAAGAEVGHLLRRLRDRLSLTEDRFQVICATASFDNVEEAKEFSSQLAGVPSESFVALKGEFLKRPNEHIGNSKDAEILASIDLDLFYASDLSARQKSLTDLLRYRDMENSEHVEADLYWALKDYSPLAKMVNITMGSAFPVSELAHAIFPEVEHSIGEQAVSNLAALASTARLGPNEASLLPCRVHSFHRGLRGLWACMDNNCTEEKPTPLAPLGATGKLYSQPIEQCACGARVLELFTCRYCGTAYARGYTNNLQNPSGFWHEPGASVWTSHGHTDPLYPIDILLEQPPTDAKVEAISYDLLTGEKNPSVKSRVRTVYLRADRDEPHGENDDSEEENVPHEGTGQFQPCAICCKSGYMGRAPVQDHETKGDQPFQVLVSRQLAVQPTGPQPATPFAPLRGRKVLTFSDSRQVAARLAPNLQMFALRDSLRNLMVRGFKKIQELGSYSLTLDDLYTSVLLAAVSCDVRLRPDLKNGESFSISDAYKLLKDDPNLSNPSKIIRFCMDAAKHKVPEALYTDIYESLRDRSRGLEALAIASIVEREDTREGIFELPKIPGVASTDQEKLDLVRAWIRCWRFAGYMSIATPQTWYNGDTSGSRRITSSSGKFDKTMSYYLPTNESKKIFKKQWLDHLLNQFAEKVGQDKWRLSARFLTLEFDGKWARCTRCRSVHRPVGASNVCMECKKPTLVPLDPESDEVFTTRKGFYRKAVLDLVNPPMTLVAAEHTAQLNSAKSDDVFSKAEQNELLFQDIEIASSSDYVAPAAIDVLSSTTTMEVGIDLGQLSAVALRNMPPGRANYQQRAGRAGRRATAIATVVAYGGSDTHDEHYFSKPEEMISGPVVDPTLSMNKVEISQRHVCAFLLQQYLEKNLKSEPSDDDANLFSVLGTVLQFNANGKLNIKEFESWLSQNEENLRQRLDEWLPKQLPVQDRQLLLSDFIGLTVSSVRHAIDAYLELPRAKAESNSSADPVTEGMREKGDSDLVTSKDSSKLLDWLLYKAVLPRYAFPTDVATFYVFDFEQSKIGWPEYLYAPTQGLAVALSQYAPGKQVWIAGKCYTSGALYSPFKKDLTSAWRNRQIFMECSRCGFSTITPLDPEIDLTKRRDCPACESNGTISLRHWMRPTGFAHPVQDPHVTSSDEIPETSYATRAQLTIASPPADAWTYLQGTPGIRYLAEPQSLLVSNTGPKSEGYMYCTACGRIEAETSHNKVLGRPHAKPYLDKEQECSWNATRKLVLGMDFKTDVALFSLQVKSPFKLAPTTSITQVALRTVSEALSRAATNLLQIEPGELLAEFRPALTAAGVAGEEAEVFLYDTLPGGAGFAIDAAKRGRALFEEALRLMEECKEKCDSSCYRCLRSFRNRIDHSLIDRHVGASLLRHLLDGATNNNYALYRISRSVTYLHDVFVRLRPAMNISLINGAGLTAARHDATGLLLTKDNGIRLYISLSNPLAEGVAIDQKLAEHCEDQGDLLLVLNELLVRKHIASEITKVEAALNLI